MQAALKRIFPVVGLLSLSCMVYIAYLEAGWYYPTVGVNFLYQSRATTPPFTSPPISYCDNILTKATQGKWVKRISLLERNDSAEFEELMEKEKELDRKLAEYRLRRGIHKKLWRDDGKCGMKNLGERPKGTKWVPSGAWCDAKSLKSCCSNEMNGMCVDPVNLSNCECPGCVDMTKILHADVSEWVTDVTCRLRNYTAVQACEVLGRFTEIHLVGDSFIRKLYRELLLIITSDLNFGAYVKSTTVALKKLCIGEEQFFWSECKAIGNSLHDLLNKSSLCGGKGEAPFELYNDVYYNVQHGPAFLDLTKRLTGKVGSMIFVGVGMHNAGNTDLVLSKYIQPAVSHIEKHYGITEKNRNITKQTWPKIVFITPDMPGILKPPQYLYMHSRKILSSYSDSMKVYCEHHNIPFIDFRQLTSGTHSYDGTHHGLVVNFLKAKILLNYLEEIQNS